MEYVKRNLQIFIILTLLFLKIHHGIDASQLFHRQIISKGPRNLEEDDESFIWITLSEKGLVYAKDLLVAQALQDLTLIHIADMKKSANVPFVGTMQATLFNVTLDEVSVPFSEIQVGETGVSIVGAEVVAYLTMNWRYSYKTWFLPFSVSDKGRALVKVEGMEVGVTLKLDEQNGTLYLIAMECGTSIKDIVITLDGGASWFYQGLVDAFEGRIRAAVESAVTAKIMEGINKLDSLLQNLPKEIPIDSTTALNVTVTQAPLEGPTSISLGIEGLFVDTSSSDHFFDPLHDLQPWISCTGPSKMLEIAISEAVLHSAAVVYFDAGSLNWLVDELPNQSLLNTASWRLFVPQLYNKYPNDDMKLNISVASPPSITITVDGVETIVVTDMIIDVVDDNVIVPVACISMIISVHGTVGISGNNITGLAGLSDITLELKWSKVGNFHMRFIEVIVRTLVKDVLLPLLNLQLKRGFPLPIIQNFSVQNADIIYGKSQIVVCTDVQYISNWAF